MKQDIRFLLTNYCNYDCYFCHNEGMKSELIRNQLSVDDYVWLFKNYQQLTGYNGVTLSGGEPLIFQNLMNW